MAKQQEGHLNEKAKDPYDGWRYSLFKTYALSLRFTVDGDTLNILLLYSRAFIEAAENIISPRQMFISKNDGRCNMDMMHSRDTIINANSMKSLCEYTEDEIAKIKRLQAMR